jgi:hypothetical protein
LVELVSVKQFSIKIFTIPNQLHTVHTFILYLLHGLKTIKLDRN